FSGVAQEVAVRQLLGAVGQVVQVEVGVELDDEAVGVGGQLLVDGQGGQVVAADPEQEVAGPERLPGGAAGARQPGGVVGGRGERQFADSDVRLVGPAAGGPAF